MAMDDTRCARCGRLPFRHDRLLGSAYEYVPAENGWGKTRVKVCDQYQAPKKKDRA